MTSSLSSLFSRISSLGSVHKLTDYGYTSMLTVTSGANFFSGGWGPLSIMDTREEYDHIRARSRGDIPPPEVPWKILHEAQPLVSKDLDGVTRKTLFRVYEAALPSPMPQHILQAMPPECRVLRARLLEPLTPPATTGQGIKDEAQMGVGRRSPVFPLSEAASVVSLPATGDHGFGRRTHIALPLLHHGISTCILEGPYYGSRRPSFQTGSKLRHVMDLFLLGRTTIEESIILLNWLRDQKDASRLGLTGLSMGGVHACLAASAYDGAVSAVPCLAPHSAATPYCYGALSLAVDFRALASAPVPEYPGMRKDQFTAIGPPLLSVPFPEVPPPPPSGPKPPPSSPYVEYLGAGAASVIEGLLARARSSEAPSDSTPQSTASPSSSPLASSSSFQGSLSILEDLIAASRGSFEYTAFRLPYLSSSASSASSSQDKDKAALPPLSPELEQTAKRHLWEVMFHFTSITLHPPPKRPDASVIVFANEDAYVDPQSPMQIAHAWPGSEVRVIEGGHVTSFVLHQAHFRRAILDGLAKL